MSLILEALRKLEREKPTPERASTVLLAPLAWGSAPRRRWPIAVLSVALVLGGALAAWWLTGGPRRSAAQPAAAAAQTQRALQPTVVQSPTVEPGREALPVAPRAARKDAPPRHARNADGALTEATPFVFRLTAIGDHEGAPVAVLNERLVRVGDALHGARIVRIAATEVELERESDGQRFTVGF